MPPRELNYVLRHLHQALLGEHTPLTDGQLLRRFLDSRDESAFETLVRRHGPMVLGVCRRVLGNAHDAEDAFQATFLVLVRKAAGLAGREVVGDWLHGVAYRTALKARAADRRRRARERAMPQPETRTNDLGPEWHALLDRELNGLPAKYRVPIVLCDLEGKTRREAARQLGWPEGTLSGRLSRGRALLARRLTRYGLTVSVGTLAQEAAPACLPAPLVQQTVVAATALAAGSAAGVVSAPIAALTEGVLKTMLVTKLKIVAGVVLLALLGLAVGVGGWTAWAADPPYAQSEPPTAPAPGADRLKDDPEETEQSALDLLPGGPMPIPCLMRLEPDDTFTLWQKEISYEPRELQLPNGQKSVEYHKVQTTRRERFHLNTAGKKVDLPVYNTAGKKVDLDGLRRLLKKETLVMRIQESGPVDPRLLRLFREGTLFLVLPPPRLPPAAAAGISVNPVNPPKKGQQTPTLCFKTKRITIHFSTKVADSPGAAAVELWHTQDDGRTWQKSTEKTDLTRPFTVEVTDDGRHGFLLVVRSGDVLSRERPRSGDQPEVWVEVDVTPPAVQLFLPELDPDANAGKVMITWNAEDRNLASHPISLYYADTGSRAWMPIALNLANTGRYEWEAPPGLSDSAHIRIQATDRAGNTGMAERRILRNRPASKPEGTISRVEPADGASR